MRRLNDVSEAWRDYLYANEENFDDPKDFLIRVELISNSHEQLLETMLKCEPDMELVAACKSEIQFQREELEEIIGSFTKYYNDSSNRTTGGILDKDEVLADICFGGTDHYMYAIAKEWQCWGERVQRVWETLNDRYGNGITYMHDDLCKLILKEVFDNKVRERRITE